MNYAKNEIPARKYPYQQKLKIWVLALLIFDSIRILKNKI